MTLRLQGEGFATAYTSVSVGDVAPEIGIVGEAVKEFKNTNEHASALLSHEIIFVLGQADIATQIHTTDFRYMRDLRYPRGKSAATAVNWVFSVPYELPDLATPDPFMPDTLRLVLHIRLKRLAYAYRGMQERIVLRLEELLRHARIPARIHVGLGWSDLIIDGTFTRDTFANVIEFVMHAHGLRLKIGKSEPVPAVQRILTLLGYSGEPPAFPGRTHVTFLRGIPGTHDGTMVDELKAFGKVYMLDGKFDFLLFTEDPVPEWLANQRVLGSDRYRGRLQKVETHLLFFDADELKNPPTDHHRIISIVDSEPLHKNQCGCRDKHSTWTGVLERKIDELGKKKLIPQEQLYAIDNILFLLGATLRDANICCDAYFSVEACYHALLTIFAAIEETDGRIPQVCIGQGTAAVHVDQRAHHEELVALIRRIDEWHRFTDLLLRQRTVGSYEEILGQTDRSVVYSGGVQKFLYLADRLINDFARRLNRQALPMATIYDSVKTTLSFPTGLVRVPTRNLFTLPVVVIDLWHEAAMILFLCRYGADASSLAPEEVSKRELLTNMADHYADLVVYFHGFGGDFDKFVASLAHGFHQTYEDVRYPVRGYAFQHTLTRIYLIYELHKVREVQVTRDAHLRRLFADPDPEPLANELTRELEVYFTSRGIRNRYPSLDIPPIYWRLLVNNVTTEDFTNYYRALYDDFLQATVQTVRPDLQAFERGEVVPFSKDVDLNSYFAELAYFIQAPDREREQSHFKMMAALGNSAAIEYHRRQITLSG